MLFSSISFLFSFLPITLFLYFIVPKQLKNSVLLICSLFFYAWGEPVYVILMILSILFNYVAGLEMGQHARNPQKAKQNIIFAVTVNLLILGFFKYYGFFIETLNAIFQSEIPYRELPLPIGISFYTFQAMSYVIDVYRKKVKPQKNFITFATYVTMFPQLIAGPIVRYADVERQLNSRSIDVQKFGSGILCFIRGLAKKVLLANTIGAVFAKISAMEPGSYSMLTAWVGCISYAFQIYYDFSGYSDMAIGLGKMFGFEFRKNFDYPYTSRSITEFWRRWHISLSTWFKEYVYIPLGGNRGGSGRTIVNLLIVWMLTGMWHGANWNFIVWGLYYGLLLILEKFVLRNVLERLPHMVRHIYTLVLVLVGWVFFFSPDMGYAIQYLGTMFGISAKGFIDKQAFFYVCSNWFVYVLAIIGSGTLGFRLTERILYGYKGNPGRKVVAVSAYMALFLICVAFLVTETFNPFLYFRF